ncbi:Transmembrane exosortase [Rubripirellula obstinata]|uniref:Transmembrane exosortase n=1 Tax=Rubripirellula obstinata TaxID=406547 RepID=A0A5B1CIU4_9BACT|nr:exosortase U [Rubripirellula obstinata]KAA1259835.1 Transmembrane exosortase [Rubripirellula obstinata]
MTSVESQTTASDDFRSAQSASEKPWWSQSGGPVFWLVCLVPALPLALAHWIGLLGDSQYAFLPLPFLVIGFLYWQRAEGTISRPETLSKWIVVALGLLAVLLGGLIAFPWLGALGFLLIAAAALSNVRGTIQKSLVGLIAPLLAISLPSGVTGIFASTINRSTAWLSSIFLDYFEMPHSVSGSVIRLFESEVITSRVCGGLVAFPFFLFIAFSLLAWKRMSLWLLPLYAVAALITTLAVNSLRLVLSVIAAESMEMELTEGWYPFAMSAIAALIGFGLLYSFHHLFAIAFHYVEPNTDAGSNPFVQFWNKFSWMNDNRASEELSRSSNRDDYDDFAPDLALSPWYGLLGTAALLSVLSIVGVFRGGSDDVQEIVSSGPLFNPTENLFSEISSNENFQINDYQSSADDTSSDPAGSSSSRRDDTWTGKFRGGNLTIQITQPLAKWIELSRAYENSGWEVIDRNNESMELVVTDENDEDAEADNDSDLDDLAEAPEEFNAFATARMRSGDGSELEGYLYFSAIDSDGKIMETPTAVGSLSQSFWLRLGMGDSSTTKPAAMIQFLVVTPEKLSPSDIRVLKREFVKHREEVARAIAGDESAASKPGPFDQTQTQSLRGPQS